MTTLPISSIAALTPQTKSQSAASTGGTSSTGSSGSTTTAANLASENVFLQLLVAQLKNQDPQQPTDGTAFVTELAQFTTLQEDSKTATDLDKIVAIMSNPPTTTTAKSNTINN